MARFTMSAKAIASMASDEIMLGTAGNDTLTLGAPVNGVHVDLGGPGDDSLFLSGAGANSVTVNNVERVVGGVATDLIDASGSTNGANLLGMGGADTIIGSDKSDGIFGGAGADLLTGGAGAANVFYFGEFIDSLASGRGIFDGVGLDSAARGVDTVTDFRSGVDKLFFFVDANANVDGRQMLSWGGQGEAQFGKVTWTSDGEGSVLVQADLTGDNVADMTIKLLGVAAISQFDVMIG